MIGASNRGLNALVTEAMVAAQRPDLSAVTDAGEAICQRVERTESPISTYGYTGRADLDPGPWRRRFGVSAGWAFVREIATHRCLARPCVRNARPFLWGRQRIRTIAASGVS